MLRDRSHVSDSYFVVSANALGRGCLVTKYVSIVALGRMSVLRRVPGAVSLERSSMLSQTWLKPLR